MGDPPTKRQNEIVAIAVELISEMGIQKLTMKRIASRMGFSEPAIYRHFDSKADLLLAILTGFKNDATRIREDVVALEGSAIKKVAALFGGLIDRFAAEPALTAVIFAEEIFQDDKRLSEMVFDLMRGNQEALVEILRIGQTTREIRDDISAEHLTIMTMGALRFTVVRWRLSKFVFDLKEESTELLGSIEKIVRGRNHQG